MNRELKMILKRIFHLPVLIGLLAILMQALDTSRDQSLFGVSHLTHASWEHLISNLVWWFLFSVWCEKVLGALRWIIFIIVGALAISFSYSMPFAPLVSVNDLILGMSALVLMQAAFLLVVKRNLLVILFLSFMLGWQFYSGNSAISQWGHGVGVVVGLMAGLLTLYLRTYRK